MAGKVKAPPISRAKGVPSVGLKTPPARVAAPRFVRGADRTLDAAGGPRGLLTTKPRVGIG